MDAPFCLIPSNAGQSLQLCDSINVIDSNALGFNPLKRGAIAATGTLFRHVFSMCYNPILHDLPTLLIKLTYTQGACFPLAANSSIRSML